MALRRINKELRDMESNPPKDVSAGPIKEDDLFNWKATVVAPEGTPYAGGIYCLSIQFPPDYPFKPPRVKFDTKVYHCNINDKGGIDCDILKDNWSPALTISKVLWSLKMCFVMGGNPDDPLMPNIARLMKTDLPKFVKIAAEWNHKYAGGPNAPSTFNANTFPNFEPWQRYWANKEKYVHKILEEKKEETMQIFVRTPGGMTYTIDCEPMDTILHIKLLMEKKCNIPVDYLRLELAGKELKNEYTLNDYSIQKEVTLHCVSHHDMNHWIVHGVIVANSKQSMMSHKESLEKQFYNFLAEMNMEHYLSKCKENECCDMDSIELFDDDILKHDIGIKRTIARRKFLAKCDAMKQEMNAFKTQYGIPSLVYKQLAKFGIVTKDILSVEVKSKSDLTNKYQIEDDGSINLLLNIINTNKINEFANEGNKFKKHDETAYI